MEDATQHRYLLPASQQFHIFNEVTSNPVTLYVLGMRKVAQLQCTRVRMHDYVLKVKVH